MHAKPKPSILLLIALIGFPQISETIYTPALPNVASGLHTTAYLVEATLSIYFLGFALGVFLWGTLSDKYGRKSTMLAGLILYGLSTVGCAKTESIEALLAWRFFQALGASVGSVITQTLLRDVYEGAERTKIFAVMSGALAFSPAIGPLLGGYISEFFGWRANFSALTLLASVLGVWTLLTLPETRPQGVKPVSVKKTGLLLIEMLKSRMLWGHILLIAATNSILFGFYQEAPFIFIEQLGIPSHHYGLFGLLIAGATACAARVSYRQCSHYSAQAIIQFGALCVLIGSALFTLLVILGMLSLEPLYFSSVLFTLLLLFFGIGLIIPNSLSQALKPYSASVGTAGSIFGGCYYLLIASFTLALSALHNGTALPLPLYMALLAGMLICASQMIRPSTVLNGVVE